MSDIKVDRIIAYVVDAIVVFIFFGVVSTILFIPTAIFPFLALFTLPLTLIGVAIVYGAYDPIFKVMGWDTQSLGKKLMKLKVVKTDGGELTINDLAIRSFLRMFPLTAIISLILWVVEGKTLHDRVVNTEVERA